MAIELDGSTQNLAGAASDVQQDEMSIAFWAAPNFAPAGTTQYYFFEVGASASFYLRKSTTTNAVRVSVDGRYMTPSVTGLWASGQWCHWCVVIRKAPELVKLYINGADVSSALAGSWGSNAFTSFVIGCNVAFGNRFPGRLGPIATWNRVLSLAEVQALAAGRNPQQISPGILHYSKLNGSLLRTIGAANLTATGSPPYAPDPFIIGTGALQSPCPSEGKGYDLNGTTQWATVASGTVAQIDEFSTSAWMRPDFAASSTTYRYIHDCDTCRIESYKMNVANQWRIGFDARYATFDITGKWVAGDWVHVVSNYKKTGDVLQLFINGVEITGPTKSGVWGTNVLGTLFKIGVAAGLGNSFDGVLSNFATFNRILTQAEVTQLATGAKANTISSLSSAILAQWDMEDDLNADVGAVNLTGVGSPVNGRHPSFKPQIRDGFEGTGYEITYPAAWTVTGTPTAGSYVDPDSPVPGNPGWAGAQCLKVKHLATENLVYISRSINGGLGPTKQHTRIWFYIPALPTGSSFYVFELVAAGGTDSIRGYITTAGVLTIQYHIAAGFQSLTTTPALAKWHDILIEHDSSGNTLRILVDGTALFSGSATIDYGPAVTLRLGPSQSATSTDGILYLSSIELRTDRDPAVLEDPTKIILREGCEGTGFDGPVTWTQTGSEDINNILDEDFAVPAGAPIGLGAHCFRLKHTDGGNSLYVNTGTIVTGVPRLYHRCYLYVVSVPSANRAILFTYAPAWVTQLHLDTGNKLRVYFNDGANYYKELSISLSTWYCVEWMYDAVAGLIQVRLDTVIQDAQSKTVTGTAGAFSVYLGYNTTVGTAEYYLDALEIRTDKWPGPIPSWPIESDLAAFSKRRKRILLEDTLEVCQS